MVVAYGTVGKADFHEITIPILNAVSVRTECATSTVVEIWTDLTDVDVLALDAHPVAGQTAVIEAAVVVHLECASLVDGDLPPSAVAAVVFLIDDPTGDFVEPTVLGGTLESVGHAGLVSPDEFVADAGDEVETVPAFAVFSVAGKVVVGIAVVAILGTPDEGVEVDTIVTKFPKVLIL